MRATTHIVTDGLARHRFTYLFMYAMDAVTHIVPSYRRLREILKTKFKKKKIELLKFEIDAEKN